MTTEAKPDLAAPPEATVAAAPSASWRKWLAVGTGVGIEIRENDLQVAIVRVRPSATSILGAATVTDYRTRPAAEWGTELGNFLRKVGANHIAATVLLSRGEVIVRQVHLPGVSAKDLDSAIRLHVDTLHPFAEEDVYFSWAALGKTGYVLVGIARRETIQHYSTLFAEAGIKIASFTFSAAVLRTAVRLITVPPSGFVALHENHPEELEVYGESESRPVFSAALPVSPNRAIGLARAELRLPPETEAVRLTDLLPKPVVFPETYSPATEALETNALPYATALAGACPWLTIEGNLLPPELRRASSRMRLIPTIVLAAILSVLLILLAIQSRWADGRYLGVLQHEIRKLEPRARRVDGLDKQISATRARTQSLDDFRRRPKLDMDALEELTKLIPAPGWISNLEMDRITVQIGGEADQAAALLKVIDSSPLFEKSEFTMPISRSSTGDLFRIRAQRQYGPPQPPAAAQPAPAQSDPARAAREKNEAADKGASGETK